MKAKKKGIPRGTSGPNKKDDKKTLIGCYILQSEETTLGGKKAARILGSQLLKKAALKAKLS